MKDNNNILNLFAAFLTSTATPATSPRAEMSLNDNISLVMVENVRRQLMKDNYDYIDSTTATTLLTNPYHNEDIPEAETRIEDIEIVNSSDKFRRKSHFHDRRSKYVSRSDNTSQSTIVVEEFHKDEQEPNLGAMRRSGTSTRKVKYSVLKIKGPSRRSASQPRLLKEEKENEVSIVNLGDGPVPQFRLPQSHRQYRAEETDSDRSESSDIANVSVSDSAIDLER